MQSFEFYTPTKFIMDKEADLHCGKPPTASRSPAFPSLLTVGSAAAGASGRPISSTSSPGGSRRNSSANTSRRGA